MITTNDIERLIEEIERLPYKPSHYQWLKDLLDEVNRSELSAVQIAIIKSPQWSEILASKKQEEH